MQTPAKLIRHATPALPGNRLLARLPLQDYQRLLPLLRPCPLEFKRVLNEPQSAIDYVYFPSQGVVSAVTLMEDALRMNSSALARHDVRVVRDFQTVPPLLCEQSKVLQILVNLIRNAKYATDQGGRSDKVITLQIAAGETGRVQLIVADNGVGIPAENLTRVFQHGFTTKPTRHGFGLHSSANAAREMKGTLKARSDGAGRGATFILDLPVAPLSPPASH